MRAAQRSNVQEGVLDYGFKQRPISQPARKIISPNIDEEKLFNMNAKVIEFKKPDQSEEDDLDDEDDEEFGSYRDRKKVAPNPRCFYYSDIGYAESAAKDRKFVNVPVSTTPSPVIATINDERMGRIIDIQHDENIYREQMMAEYGRQCPCAYHKEAFTR